MSLSTKNRKQKKDQNKPITIELRFNHETNEYEHVKGSASGGKPQGDSATAGASV